MALFRYQALNESGKKMYGAIDAESMQDAKLKLIRLQILAIKIHPISQKEMQKPLNRPELLALSREISRLLQAGLPLFETLSALEEKYRGQKAHKILLDLSGQIKIGHPLSSALRRHPNTFDILYVSMVQNAEKSGRLAICFEELSQLIARQLYVRKQIISALLYPSLLMAFCMVVLSSLLFFVVPSLRELFEGRDLHPFTRIVFAASEFACSSKYFLALCFLVSCMFLTTACLSKRWKKQAFAIACKMPVFKSLFAQIALARFARASSTLLEGGISLIETLAQARTVMRHPVLEGIIARCEQRIVQGEHLSVCLANQPLIPPLIPRMLGIAEQSGKLSFTMRQIAEVYEEELETKLTHFANLAQPVLLLFLGALVGFVLLSVLLPLTDVNSFVN